MRKVFIMFFLLFAALQLSSQKFGSRSAYEKRWAIFHPCAALKVKKIYKECLPFYETAKRSNSLDVFLSGGKLDAFRHAYFMAAFSQKIKVKKLRKLGKAHEKGNYKHFLKGIKEEGELADSLSTVMDLFNNELGFNVGAVNKKTELNTLYDIIIAEIQKGNALYFKRNGAGQYLTCVGEVINLMDFKNKWYIPKCLVKTTE